MSTAKCNRCDWEGPLTECIEVPVCPDCTTGHNPMYRMIRKRDRESGEVKIQCPNCSWLGEVENANAEPECPKCRNQYLIISE